MDQDSCNLLCLDLPKAERVRGALPSVIDLETTAQAAKALADPTRLRIVLALRDADELCVCDLAWIVERQDKLVSHHLRQLRHAEMARSRRAGKMVLYSLTDLGIRLVGNLMAEVAAEVPAA